MPQTTQVSFTLSVNPAAGEFRYVRPDGNDANTGTADTAAGAWRTLQKAADTVQAGWTVRVRPGTYAGFRLTTGGSSEATRISFLADPGVIINQVAPLTVGSGVESGIAVGWNLTVPFWVTIQGFTFGPTGGEWYAAIRCAGKQSPRQSHIRVVGNTCTMRPPGTNADKYGIYCAWQDWLEVEGNTITGCYNSGIYVANSSNDYIVRSNLVSGCGGNGIHNNGDGTAGGVGLNFRGLIERNRITGCGFGIGGQGISCDGLRDSRIQNNLMVDNAAKGFSLYVTNASGGSQNNVVVNNTVVHPTTATGSPFRLPGGGNTSNVVFNNVFLARNTNVNSDGHYSYSVEDDSTFDYNAVTDPVQRQISLASWRGIGNDAHGFAITPAQLTALFVNPVAGDYHAKPGGPLVGTGTASLAGKPAPADDFDGNPRVGMNVGCY